MAAVDDKVFRESLDALQTNVFYADKNLELSFINKIGIQTTSTIEDEIYAAFGIKVDQLVGQNLDAFHGDRKKEIRKILKDPRNFPYNAEIKLADLILNLNINIVKNAEGDIEGYVVNWEEISEKKRLTNEASRTQQMVDKSPINTLMASPEGVMTYMNENSFTTLKTLESDLPDRVENFVGKSIDQFHKNPAHQRGIIADPKNLPHKAVIQVGAEKLDLLVSAVIDNEGNYLGPMVNWDVVTLKFQLVNELTNSSQQLGDAATSLLEVSNSMSSAAEETSAQSNTASAASAEVNVGVQNVATNMEEMVASVKEITKTTNEASAMSNDAMNMAQETNKIIAQLGESSMDIGNVIKVISSIAQQTNLLALNATIEAARAGEAGKGFAVVANEVKELAKQTAKATEDITKKIETIQEDSKGAVKAIAEISESIEKVNGYASNIAASVEEQAATTNEVTRVVTESAKGVNQINENINQVSEAAAQTGKDAIRAQEQALNLQNLADALSKQVDKVNV